MARKILRQLVRLIPFLLVFALLAALVFYPPEGERGEKIRVVRVWNVDTFEGGKGSRTSFLKGVAARCEKERTGVYYLVTDYTAEGAEKAFSEGERPDIFSFGIGCSVHAEYCLPLGGTGAGGAAGGRTLALPWCRGSYYLFSQDGFEGAGETVLSEGGSNLTLLAARLANIEGKPMPSMAAYTEFLGGKYRYLLGTQRDVCRFSARGVRVEMRPVTVYNDLYQYISILSSQKWDDCAAFLGELLSPRTQTQLSSIGMLPAAGDGSEYTVSAFLDKAALAALKAAASDGEKNLDKYLITVLKKTGKCGIMVGT